MRDIDIRVARVSVNGHAEQVGAASGVDEAQGASKIRLAFGLVDQLQRIANRFDAGSLDGVRVQEGTVQCPRQHRRAVIVFQNIPDLILCVLRKLVEGTIAGTVIRQTVRVDPWAVDVTEQIGGRFDDGRERCRVDAGFQCFTHGNKPSPGSTRGKALHIGKSVHIANRERLLSWENAHPRERKTNPTHIRMRPETERNNHERLQPDERHAE